MFIEWRLQRHSPFTTKRTLFLSNSQLEVPIQSGATSLFFQVVGVPVTFNGDLKNQFVQPNVGFDTICKVNSQLISNVCTYALSAEKYYYFIRLMGRKASHVALECTLQSHPNMVILVSWRYPASRRAYRKHPCNLCAITRLLQSTILESVGCIWFDRSEAKDREIVARKLREHVEGADNNPLLIFPEGTCVNNHYSIMFKKGPFELGLTEPVHSTGPH
ncbi:hypothetical protein L2E82_03180 [Cichorium intybus]|uniref:Uncharacterized protein n=1 Tax=Cichorium intybus TaxID=13427 RepID=A0ACB9H414_CICIN|nr:hypothetical protein L2E82_03180 [Cichorium intybus]